MFSCVSATLKVTFCWLVRWSIVPSVHLLFLLSWCGNLCWENIQPQVPLSLPTHTHTRVYSLVVLEDCLNFVWREMFLNSLVFLSLNQPIPPFPLISANGIWIKFFESAKRNRPTVSFTPLRGAASRKAIVVMGDAIKSSTGLFDPATKEQLGDLWNETSRLPIFLVTCTRLYKSRCLVIYINLHHSPCPTHATDAVVYSALFP